MLPMVSYPHLFTRFNRAFRRTCACKTQLTPALLTTSASILHPSPFNNGFLGPQLIKDLGPSPAGTKKGTFSAILIVADTSPKHNADCPLFLSPLNRARYFAFYQRRLIPTKPSTSS